MRWLEIEELEAELNGRWDYLREAYGATAVDPFEGLPPAGWEAEVAPVAVGAPVVATRPEPGPDEIPF